MTPAATFGIELVVQVPCADKLLNALQAKMVALSFGLPLCAVELS